MTRRLKKGGYTAILSLMAIAAVVLINMIAGRLPENMRKWDLSGTQIYTVGDTTKELLAALEKEVTIYVVADPAIVDERITSFLQRYADLTERVEVENVDSVLHPDQVKQLGAENNTILIKCDDTGKTETLQMSDIIKYDEMSYYYYGQMVETEFDGEGQLTSAIAYVTNDVQKNVYVTEGHGEAEIGTLAFDMLEKSGLTVNSVNLLTEGKIPEDCELLLINAPVNDLADDEKSMVDEYVNGGGKILFIAGYSDKDQPNLNSMINGFGLNLEKGLAADTKNYYQNNPYYIFPTIAAASEVTSGIDQKSAALVLQSAAFSQMENMPDGVTVDPFLETTDGGMVVTENGQTQGTYILGAAAEKTADSGTARLTVFGSSSLIDDGLNSTFTNLTNLEIFMNAVTANFEDVINVSIPSKSLEVTYNTVTHGGMWGILFILVIPVVTIAAGLVVWLRRRRL